MEKDKQVKCLRCKYYYNTWNPQKPRGCRVFGFEASTIPSYVVRKETGKNCEAYKEKVASNKASKY
ncbi:hypothetical protein OAK75_07350 [Bacteriovoracales bacterium]|nr:hypothetical protein [Bacteriovoracales bacterium]